MDTSFCSMNYFMGSSYYELTRTFMQLVMDTSNRYKINLIHIDSLSGYIPFPTILFYRIKRVKN